MLIALGLSVCSHAVLFVCVADCTLLVHGPSISWEFKQCDFWVWRMGCLLLRGSLTGSSKAICLQGMQWPWQGF